MTDKWIQKTHIKHGALHKQLGYSKSALLPEGLLNEIGSANIGTHVRGDTVTPLLKKRVNFALNVRK
jgi:hypothetical protein